MDSAEDAFNSMIVVAQHYEMDLVSVEPRSYKKIFRPADQSVDEFIDGLTSKANPNNPVWCLQIEPKKYVLFGAIN
jgi:hypothetical protein